MQVADSDVLTAIKFSFSGEYLALGDSGGRVIIFKRSTPSASTGSATKHSSSRYFDYKYLTEIQSHEPEFDCLKSLELDEKINAIEFLRDSNTLNNNPKPGVSFLSTNDRVIKLWKVDYRIQK